MTRYAITAVAHYKFVLVLNPMRGRTEDTCQIGPFDSREEAIEALEQARVAPYPEKGVDAFNGGVKVYSKSFRQGGPFEWCNPLTAEELVVPNRWGHGIHPVLSRVTDIVPLHPLAVSHESEKG